MHFVGGIRGATATRKSAFVDFPICQDGHDVIVSMNARNRARCSLASHRIQRHCIAESEHELLVSSRNHSGNAQTNDDDRLRDEWDVTASSECNHRH